MELMDEANIVPDTPALLAQTAERLTCNEQVPGSTPGEGSNTPPEPTLEERREAEKAFARARFDDVIRTKTSKPAVKDFLLERCTHFLGQNKDLKATRQQRRLAAKLVARRMTKQVMNGEDIFNAGV
jgi:hypothetical protein